MTIYLFIGPGGGGSSLVCAMRFTEDIMVVNYCLDCWEGSALWGVELPAFIILLWMWLGVRV